MIVQRVSREDLVSISACLALALCAHLGTLPPWIMGTVAVAGGVRLVLAHRGLGAPPRAVRLMIAAAAIALLFAQFHTFNGLAAGTALLALMAGLKLMETETRRDVYIITLIIYFVSISALLDSDSFWLLAYLIGVCWVTTATLLRLTTARPAPPLARGMRYAARILAQALPLALALWLLFPRFSGPLWRIPAPGAAAATGLSDTMSPGDIDQLSLSDEVAFRVRFEGSAPPSGERYWRGPVMHDFDGRMWSRSYLPPATATGWQPKGPAYRYTISLEPHQHNWIFALDWPAQWDLPRGGLSGDYTLMQRDPVTRIMDVVATSYTRIQMTAPLNGALRQRDTYLRPQHNPRTKAFAQSLRSMHPDDMDYIQSVLGMFFSQPFYYTLTPPKLGAESVDEFLFDSKRGFCEHYASAFANLMRAAGIPARVVTGYQGGTFNRFADYWILRQSDAHAWDEVWIEGRGWIRVDPTSAIAPGRVERGLTNGGSVDGALGSRWERRSPWFADARLRLDALGQLWRERILLYDQDSQHDLLEFLRIPEPDGQKLVMVLAVALTVALIWLTWQVRRELDPAPKERVLRAFSTLCDKLARIGVARLPHEGAEAYATRVAAARPDLGPTVSALCRHFSALRYAPAPARITLNQFETAVRAFRPGRVPRAEPTGGTMPPDFPSSSEI